MAILIVDDEKIALGSAQRLLNWEGYTDVEICDNGREAIDRIKDKDFDLVLLDILMPEVDGLQVLEAAKPFRPRTEFIMLTALDDVKTAVKAIRLGAYDYLTKPVDSNLLFLTMERAFERRGLLAGFTDAGRDPAEIKLSPAFDTIITRCPRMLELLSYTEIMARSGNPIMITGDSGTGKELLARAVHGAGPGSAGPFIAVNVPSVPESMFESQFFGHVKGAYTGAIRDYPGFFEQADNGAIFLDEIGEIPLHLQTKFLRVLEEKSVIRLGATRQIPLNIRIVSATNTDMDKACQEGRFRLDLMYRLKSVHVHLPPLKERIGDVELLATHFLEEAGKKHNKEIKGFSPDALAVLLRHDFPGNIRELAQIVENGVLLADSTTLQPHHLGEKRHKKSRDFTRTPCTFKENYETHLAYVLQHTGGDRKKAAEILGVSLRQIHRKLAELEGGRTAGE